MPFDLKSVNPAPRVRRLTIAAALLVTVALTGALHAASFAVPDDEVYVRSARAIVIASAQASRVEKNQRGGIETITTFYVRDVLKGDVPDVVDVIEPGGTLDGTSLILPGVPRFTDGEEYLLFLSRSSRAWHIRDLALGKFAFRTDISGRRVLVRDEQEINGFDSKGGPHREKRRSADEFLRFVRAAASGGPAKADYIVPAEPLLDPDFADGRRRGLLPFSQSHGFSAASYTYFAGEFGGRWNVFPGAVGFFSIGSVSGAPMNGIGAINTAFASWNNDPNSNVNYVYSGPDNGTHNSGVDAPDGANTIAFEVDIEGVDPLQCSPNSYSGVFGLGGFTLTGVAHMGPNGEPFSTGIEADVVMNQGISGCTFAINNGDFNSAVTHEVGHTLGFRHSDQDRQLGGTCTAAVGECAAVAIMKSFIPSGVNAVLQPWDQNAVSHVYPSSGMVPAAPTGVVAMATSSTSVNVTWTAVDGATSYQIDRRAPGGGFVMIGTSMTNFFNDMAAAPNTAYLYLVRAVNAGGPSSNSGSDLATTVIFTNDTLAAGITIQAAHLSELRTAVNAVRSLAGVGTTTFTDAASAGVTVKAVHINELRTRLDEALGPLGRATGGYTDTVTAMTTTIRAIHFQEIRNRVK